MGWQPVSRYLKTPFHLTAETSVTAIPLVRYMRGGKNTRKRGGRWIPDPEQVGLFTSVKEGMKVQISFYYDGERWQARTLETEHPRHRFTKQQAPQRRRAGV